MMRRFRTLPPTSMPRVGSSKGSALFGSAKHQLGSTTFCLIAPRTDLTTFLETPGVRYYRLPGSLQRPDFLGFRDDAIRTKRSQIGQAWMLRWMVLIQHPDQMLAVFVT